MDDEKLNAAAEDGQGETAAETPAPKPKNAVSEIFDVFELFLYCSVVIFLIFTFFAKVTVVKGESMEHTLHGGDYLVVSDLFYTPAQGDIVVVQNTSLKGLYGEPLVKRVIATENQLLTIDYNTWTVTVDGRELDEPYIYLDPAYSKTGTVSYKVPEGHVFVMGDNRYHSGDSRSPEIGMIDTRCVVGRVLFRLFPIASFGDPDAAYGS